MPFDPSNAPGSPLLSTEGLAKSYAPARPVFADVPLTLDRGEFVCIIGHSGCGKTTILNVLAGLDTASAGYIFMDGREVAGPTRAGLHHLPGYYTLRNDIVDFLVGRARAHCPSVLPADPAFPCSPLHFPVFHLPVFQGAIP